MFYKSVMMSWQGNIFNLSFEDAHDLRNPRKKLLCQRKKYKLLIEAKAQKV